MTTFPASVWGMRSARNLASASVTKVVYIPDCLLARVVGEVYLCDVILDKVVFKSVVFSCVYHGSIFCRGRAAPAEMLFTRIVLCIEEYV
jgi:hypothetical protein